MSDKFECPAIRDPWDGECEFFGLGTHYCPYAAFSFLKEREELPDCPHAPELIWKSFKNQKERKEFRDALAEGGSR